MLLQDLAAAGITERSRGPSKRAQLAAGGDEWKVKRLRGGGVAMVTVSRTYAYVRAGLDQAGLGWAGLL